VLKGCCLTLAVFLVVVRMYQTEIEESFVTTEMPEGLGLWYDAERLILEGAYLDEITAYRARRRWIETFEMNFLLEASHDFGIKVVPQDEDGRFFVRCAFLTACGRYAFWRLTHHQAPDVQFLLETAHLPFAAVCPSRIDSFVSEHFDQNPSVLFQSSSYRESKATPFQKLLRHARTCVKRFVEPFLREC
jgi:hypothetical protein